MEENKPRSLLSGFLSGTFFTGIGSISTILAGFVGLMLTARWVPAEEIGIFVLVQLIVTFMVGLSDFGLGLTVTQLISRNENNNHKQIILNTSIIFRIITALIAAVLALIGRELLFNYFDGTLNANMLIYIPILILIESLIQLYQSVLEGLFKFRAIAVVDLVISISYFLALLVLVGYFRLGIIGLIFVRLTSRGIGLLIAFFSARISFRFEFSFARLKEMLRFGLPLYLNYILDFTFNQAGTFIIGALLGPAQIAFFEYARKIPDSLEMLYNAFRQVYFPTLSHLFSSDRKQEASNILNHSNRLIAFFGVLGTFVAYFFGKEIIVTFFSAEFLPSVTVFYILMINLTLKIIDATLGYSLVAVGESNKPVLINSLRAIVTLSSYAILIPIPAMGIIGAALSTILGTIIANPINIFFLRRKQVQAKFSTFLKPFAIFLALYLPCYFLLPELNLLLKLAGFSLYFLFSLLFHVIKLEDLNSVVVEIKTLIQRKTTA